ncbi:hypothetical protein B0H11DRAFT_2041266, partial [Mycena galericulata]
MPRTAPVAVFVALAMTSSREAVPYTVGSRVPSRLRFGPFMRTIESGADTIKLKKNQVWVRRGVPTAQRINPIPPTFFPEQIAWRQNEKP